MAAGIEETQEMWTNREIKLKEVIHAEDNCLLNCPFNFRNCNCTIYITHQPCPRCIIKLYQAKIKRIIYNLKYEKMGDLDIWKKYASKFSEIKQIEV